MHHLNTTPFNSLQHHLLYSLAGQIGWIVSIAPDVVKSTIQTSEAPLGIIETTKQIVASRGVRGLFAGVEVGRCYVDERMCVCVTTIKI
jgi:Mitochondrial carrier protein